MENNAADQFPVDLRSFWQDSNEYKQEVKLNGRVIFDNRPIDVSLFGTAFKTEDEIFLSGRIETDITEICVRCLKKNTVHKNLPFNWQLDPQNAATNLTPRILEELGLAENYYPKCQNNCKIVEEK